ncbi:MAG TPA: acyltransferase family protein [Anaerolineales bacterium]|nr:acyltransferase family protein [Anaerolineales bacterium]
MNTVPSKRIEYLDIARGLGILLVVLGHNDLGALSPFAHQVIYSFHIPLFFFLSGYFINTSISFFDYFKKRFHSILKPYLFTIFLIYFASVSFEKMSFQNAIGRILKSLYGSIDYIDWGQLWFLPQLFVVSLYAFIFISLVSRLRNRWLTWGILIATLAASLPFLHVFYPFTLSIFGKEYEIYGLPFSLDVVFLSGFFFILGNEVRQAASEKTFDSILLLIVSGIGMILLNTFFPYRVDIAVRVYESFLLNTAEAILGILFALALSRQTEMHSQRLGSLFKYFGNISLIILLFHVPIQEFWGQKVMALTKNLPFSILAGFIMGVLGPVLIYEIFIRFNPVASFWFGRKAELPARKEYPVQEEQTAVNPPGTPAVEIKEQ